jgi:AAA family ATP:ADP antiporter
MATDVVEQPPNRSWIERVLSPVAEVHRDEVTSALLMTLVMFLILGAYYLLKTAREVFILSEGGAEVKSYSSAGQALLLLILVPVYSSFASRVKRVQLVQWVTLFFASHLFVFLFLLRTGTQIGIVYFLWVGIFNLMVIAQFWAFANDLYTPEQGKRLFPLIGVGSSLGAWVGSLRAGDVMERFGPTRLLILASVILVGCAVLVRIIDRVSTRPSAAAQAATARKDEPLSGPNGFTLMLQDRYLLLIAALVLVLNIVNTSGEYLFGRYVVDTAHATYGTGPESEAARQQFIGATYSRFFSSVNLVGFLLQMFAVSRIFKFLGVGRALFIHPIAALTGYVYMLGSPSLGAMNVFKIVDNSLDYSLGNTTKQALWLPTSREAKYKAKQAVDSFVVRAGDVLQAAVVYTGELLKFTVPMFAGVNIALSVVWLAVAAGLGRMLKAKARQAGTSEL